MSKSSPVKALIQGTASALAGVVGMWLLYSRFGINHDLPLPPAIDAEREQLSDEETGTLSYYADRSGTSAPLVLIHSINAAGCSYEMRPIFEAYRGRRAVYALDLPGFGFSERGDRAYSPELYKDAILRLLEKIDQPADVVALSLSSEFAARAALEQSERFRSLTLISPSGFTAREKKGASQQANQSGTSDTLYRLFSAPLWGQAFYDLIATRPSIHYFLQQSFVGQVDPGLEAYGYQTSHQPGAHHAPLYFVSGKLFTPDIRAQVYEKLTIPALVIFDRDFFVRFDTLLELVETREKWRVSRIAPTKGLPQFELLDEVTRALDGFWDSIQIQTTH